MDQASILRSQLQLTLGGIRLAMHWAIAEHTSQANVPWSISDT